MSICFLLSGFRRDVSATGNSMSFSVQNFLLYRVSTFLISGVFCSLRNCTIIFRPKLYARFNSIRRAANLPMFYFIGGAFPYGLSTADSVGVACCGKGEKAYWDFFFLFTSFFSAETANLILENAQKKGVLVFGLSLWFFFWRDERKSCIWFIASQLYLL